MFGNNATTDGKIHDVLFKRTASGHVKLLKFKRRGFSFSGTLYIV